MILRNLDTHKSNHLDSKEKEFSDAKEIFFFPNLCLCLTLVFFGDASTRADVSGNQSRLGLFC